MLHPGSTLPPPGESARLPMPPTPARSQQGPLVGLFVTCLVDLFRPSVGFAAVKLLEDAGARVEVPRAQTCCGQPAYNSGDRARRRGRSPGRWSRHSRATTTWSRRRVPAPACCGCITRELFADDPRFRRARRRACRQDASSSSSFLVRCAQVRPRRCGLCGKRHLSRFLLGLARARHVREAAAAAARQRRRA